MNFQWTKNGIIIKIPDSIDPNALREALEYLKQLNVSGNIAYQGKAHVELENNNLKTNQTNEISSDKKNNSDQSRLSFSDFSFSKSRKTLENYKGSFSDTVIAERRTAL